MPHGGIGSRMTKALRARRKFALLIVVAACVGVGGTAHTAAPQASAATKQQSPTPATRIDINHASVDELMKVPGMTQTWAARIVRFRPYRTKQDLLDKGVVTSQVYDRIKDYVIAHRDKQ
jgi:competence protein ComEA